VWEWFLRARTRNLGVSGPVVQKHAKEVAEKLGEKHVIDG
jgi:hypothetical protein